MSTWCTTWPHLCELYDTNLHITFSINYIILWLWYCQSFQQMFTFCSLSCVVLTLSHFQNHTSPPPFPLHLFSLFIFLIICIFVSNYNFPMHLWWLKKSKENKQNYYLIGLQVSLFSSSHICCNKCRNVFSFLFHWKHFPLGTLFSFKHFLYFIKYSPLAIKLPCVLWEGDYHTIGCHFFNILCGKHKRCPNLTF